MVYGYSRCSTNETKQDLMRQERELKDSGAEFVYKEFEHGDSETKKELNRLIDSLSEGDTLKVTEVSRISRSTKQLCEFIEMVKEKHIRFEILNSITIDCRNGKIDPMSEAFLKMAGVFSELELSMIRSRVRSGMANAKAKGKVIGRPTFNKEMIPSIFYKHYPLYKNGQITKKEYATLCGISRPTLDRYINAVEE